MFIGTKVGLVRYKSGSIGTKVGESRCLTVQEWGYKGNFLNISSFLA